MTSFLWRKLWFLVALLRQACLLSISPLPPCLQAMLRYDSEAREVRLVADRAYREGGSILATPHHLCIAL